MENFSLNGQTSQDEAMSWKNGSSIFRHIREENRSSAAWLRSQNESIKVEVQEKATATISRLLLGKGSGEACSKLKWPKSIFRFYSSCYYP
jgi:hypothetical protein